MTNNPNSNPVKNRTVIFLTSTLFVLSGFSALVYQTVLNKYFSFIFGVSSHAVATVLATFMLGLAVGSYIFGKLSVNWIRRPLLTFGVVELAIGVYGLLFLDIASVVEQLYLSYAKSHSLSTETVTLFRFLSATILVGIPTLFMGGSLPLLIEGVKRRGVVGQVNLLYAFNIVGACTGTILGAYYLLPFFQLDGSLNLVFYLSLVIFATCLAMDIGIRQIPLDLMAKKAKQNTATKIPIYLIAIAFFSGYSTFSNEVYWNHMLSLVVGTSTYAYSIMLFTTLFGMAVAGFVVQKYSDRWKNLSVILLGSQLLLATSILFTMPLWDDIPGMFLLIGVFIESFSQMEMLRFTACFALIAIPAFCAGLTFPITLKFIENTAKNLGADIGRLYSVNTLGSILGALLGGFLLLGALGGKNALLLSAFCSIVAGTLLPPLSAKIKAVSFTMATAVFTLTVYLLPPWDTQALLSGANIYFEQAHDHFDSVVWQNESNTGGVTSVIKTGDMLTMLTNGKFQGNNGSEVVDQQRFALIPNLFVREAGQALNIGLGTGGTLGVISRFPYKHIDVVELSEDVIYAADQFFKDINYNSLNDDRVTVHVQDGRNFLALLPEQKKYDLISIELTSIWFAGAGNLYNDEFYALTKRTMTKTGVLQQWIQLHHISMKDIAVILKTVRKHYKHVQLWVPKHQGILIASNSPLSLQQKSLDILTREKLFGRTIINDKWSILGELLLDTGNIDKLIAEVEKTETVPYSTDNNLYLEYSTPKGNALGWNFTENISYMLKFSDFDLLNILPPNQPSSDLIKAIGTLERAHFFPKFSTSWHRQVSAAFEMLNENDRKILFKKLKTANVIN